MTLIDISFSSENQEGTQSMLARWLKRVGEPVKQHEPLIEVSTDKVTVEIAAPESGTLREILFEENSEIKPGDILGRLELADSDAARSVTPTSKAAPAAAHSTGTQAAGAELSPAVRKLVKEHNLDLSKISGSGRAGRITHEDVQRYLEEHPAGVAAQPSSSKSRRIKHNPMRIGVAKHMTQSLLHTAPHVTSVFEANLANIIADREKKKADFEAQGVKLTYTAYFVQATVAALKHVPEVNSRWHDNELEIFEDFNIGIAAALEQGGLIVPVIAQAQKLDLFGAAKALQELTSKARNNQLSPAEVQNGTFTISNHGVSGSLFAAPIIINQPQSAILGIGKLENRPKVIERAGKSEIVVEPCAYVTLTIDHRVLDGFQANAFLSRFVEKLQDLRTP